MKEQLREFGFSEKEVAVYTSLLGLGNAVASDVAKKAKVNRSTTYVVLESLVERSLVVAVERRGVRIYRLAPPEKLVEYLANSAKRFEHLTASAKKLLPELKAMYKPEEMAKGPKVHFFEGKAEMKGIYEDTLSSLEGIRAYASVEESTSKSKQEAKVQVIFPDTREAKMRLEASKEGSGSAIHSEINIYDDKVIFISPSENSGFIIESKEFAKTLKKAITLSRKEAKLNAEGKRLAEGLA